MGLKNLLIYEEDVASELNWNFTIQIKNLDSYETRKLLPNRESIPVTQENKKEFVDLYVDFVLNKSIEPLWDAFKRGFYKVCGGEIMMSFKPEELE